MTNTEIALIGSGPVSHYHVPALEEVGLDVTAVASMNPNSDTVEKFGEKFNIEDTFKGESWREMVSDRSWDGIVIATHISGTPEALNQCLTDDVPILVEKPVGWTSKRVHELREKAHDEVIVGYNRRHYEPIQEAKKFLDEHRPVIATIELPAPSNIKSFIGTSSHGVDILRYLFGELNVLDTYNLTDDGKLQAYTATLRSESDDLINVIGNWDAPSNIGLNIDYHDLRFQLEPYEQARKYKGFRIKEPTDDMPVRQYIPKKIEEINVEIKEGKYKPGFYKQALSYKKLIQNGEINEPSADLYDAEKTLELCEELLPEYLPKESYGE